MPLELIADRPGHAVLMTYEDTPFGEAYLDMNEHPERGIKLGVDHTLED
jgi:hypothetical protein